MPPARASAPTAGTRTSPWGSVTGWVSRLASRSTCARSVRRRTRSWSDGARRCSQRSSWRTSGTSSPATRRTSASRPACGSGTRAATCRARSRWSAIGGWRSRRGSRSGHRPRARQRCSTTARSAWAGRL